MARIMPIRRGVVLTQEPRRKKNAFLTPLFQPIVQAWKPFLHRGVYRLIRFCMLWTQGKRLWVLCGVTTLIYGCLFVVYSLSMLQGHHEYVLMRDTRKRNERLTMKQFQHASLQSIHQMATGLQRRDTLHQGGLVTPEVVLALPAVLEEDKKQAIHFWQSYARHTSKAWIDHHGVWQKIASLPPAQHDTFSESVPYWQRRF
ncbi:MAG: hypothetical protein ACKO37_00310 [Vampirovibrionales bacterium]